VLLLVARVLVQPQSLAPGDTVPLAESSASASGFPSGHAIVGVATALAISRTTRWWWMAGLLLAVFAPLARVYLGQDRVSDVLGGAGLGLLIGALVLRLPSRVWLDDGTALDTHPVYRLWPEVLLFGAGAWMVRYHHVAADLPWVPLVLGNLLMLSAPFLAVWNLHVRRAPARGHPPPEAVSHRYRPLNMVLFILGCAWTAWCLTVIFVP
jgi:hypothetical protein